MVKELGDERRIYKASRPHTNNHKIYNNQKRYNLSFKQTIDLCSLCRKVKVTRLKDLFFQFRILQRLDELQTTT